MKLKLHQVTEIAFSAPAGAVDYYASFVGIFTCGDHVLTVPAYCKGKGQWAIHFSADMVGEWSYTVVDQIGGGAVLDGQISCVEADGDILLPLAVTKGEIRPLFTAGGEPVFVKSYECDWLFALWMSDRAGVKRLVEKICAHGFNTILMNVYAYGCDWTDPNTPDRLVPPPVYCWGGSNDAPNFDVFNEDFYTQLDELFAYLQEMKIYAYTYYFVYNKNVAYPPRDSAQEAMYIKQICARYQAYPNAVWVYAKELYFNSNKANAIAGMKLIRATDGYQRLLTFHDDKQLMSDPEARAITDFHTLQQHSGFYEYTNELVRNDDRPVFHSEFGYEPGASLDDITYTEAQNIREFLMRAWDVALAGAGICYYYTFTGWDVIRPDDTPPGYAMFKTLHDFFDGFDWWNYENCSEFPMWTPSRCIKHCNEEKYVFKTNHHGSIMLDRVLGETKYRGTWLNPFTGETKEFSDADTSIMSYNMEATVFTSPFFANRTDDYSILQLEILS